jgi:hypothetical protein
MTEDLVTDYADPVRRLLTLGETHEFNPEKWPHYPARFGLGHEHVPELIRMACDLELHGNNIDDAPAWAPTHAWRTLAQLRAEEAIEPLLTLRKTLPEHDSVCEDVPLVLSMIGPVAIPPLTAFIADQLQDQNGVASAGIDALRRIAIRHPEKRDECVGILTGMLERHAETDPTVNGFIVAALLNLKGVESINAMRAAFDADSVDISIAGDKEDVEIELGLREKRDTPKPRYQPLLEMLMAQSKVQWRTPPAAQRDWATPSLKVYPPREGPKIGRNDPCPCGSGKKFKKCCMT